MVPGGAAVFPVSLCENLQIFELCGQVLPGVLQR